MEITFKKYLVQCITNLHAGSGDANYGVVDKLVQRDPVTNYPTIHSSSLKGGLREHFESKWGKSEKVDAVFGREAKGKSESETGDFKFLGGDLVSLPVRCNFNQYVMALNNAVTTSINEKSILLNCGSIFNSLGTENKLVYESEKPSYDVYAEDKKLESKVAYTSPCIKIPDGFNSFGNIYAVFNNEDFKSIAENLPVIARNYIENGKSTNLWYEEVVPHQSVFITYIAYDSEHKYKTDFEDVITKDIIQIGANATVGYGLCKFFKLD